MTDGEITYAIRGAIYDVYMVLGPGLLESAYEMVLAYHLRQEGFAVQTQVPISLSYGDIEIPMAYRLDMLVNDKVIVELKSVDSIEKIHYKQLRTYLRLSHKHTGILVNFNTQNILNSIHTIHDVYDIPVEK